MPAPIVDRLAERITALEAAQARIVHAVGQLRVDVEVLRKETVQDREAIVNVNRALGRLEQLAREQRATIGRILSLP